MDDSASMQNPVPGGSAPPHPVDLTKQQGFVPPQGGFPPPMGSPAPPGMPPPTGYPAPLPEEKPRFSKRRIIGIVVVLVVALGGTVGNALNRKAASHADAGDCIKINELKTAKAGSADQDADIDKVACTDPAAFFKVGVRLQDDTGSCPAGDYIEYYERGGSGGDFKLCLTYNVAAGDCWEEGEKPVRTACTAEPGKLRIKALKVVPGVSDPGRCDGAAKTESVALTYSTPPQTICVTKV